MCGGTYLRGHRPIPQAGLSPRVRGNLTELQGPVAELGSIPACAGEPSLEPVWYRMRWVYPRVCGGTIMLMESGTLSSGLSPRVRGNLALGVRPQDSCGSIPACAGEPPQALPSSRTCGVYPRVCGGTSRSRRTSAAPCGLSPRVRGNRRVAGLRDVGVGSIPACAGEPLWQFTAFLQCGVYPRVCGGTGDSGNGDILITGLSPRVRGNRRRVLVDIAVIGSIPACAGEPGSLRTRPPYRPIYPRVCGGTQNLV